MASKKAVHTMPHGEGWANVRDGARRVSKVFGSKSQAQAAGRKTAMRERVEHLVHNADGSVGQRNSYGGDPHPPKG